MDLIFQTLHIITIFIDCYEFTLYFNPMILTLLTGISLIGAGAFTAGSFAVPFGKIRDWKWESGWLIYGVGAYILFSLLVDQHCIFLYHRDQRICIELKNMGI